MDNEVGVISPESTTQTLPSFEEYTSPVTYLKEVEKTLGTPIEVEHLNKIKLVEVGLNCNHNTPLSSRVVPSFDGPEPQPLLNSPSLDMFDNDWGLESKEVSPLGEELSLFDRLYLMRRNLEVLRKFHLTTLGGRFNQLSHVSSLLLSKPGEY
ncbi:hypothetical protein Tco_1384438 [Tanacetum coccineum]